MTDRKPDFYVVKREGLDGAPEWFTFDADGHVWDYQLTLRHRFVTEADAAKIAKKYGGSVAPVCCTSKRADVIHTATCDVAIHLNLPREGA